MYVHRNTYLHSTGNLSQDSKFGMSSQSLYGSDRNKTVKTIKKLSHQLISRQYLFP